MAKRSFKRDEKSTPARVNARQVKSHEIAASKNNPQYMAQRDNSGSKAAHKPTN